jgi:hypothetical protein
MINIIISSCVILGEVQDTLTIRKLKAWHRWRDKHSSTPTFRWNSTKYKCVHSLLLINNRTLPCAQPVSCHQWNEGECSWCQQLPLFCYLLQVQCTHQMNPHSPHWNHLWSWKQAKMGSVYLLLPGSQQRPAGKIQSMSLATVVQHHTPFVYRM